MTIEEFGDLLLRLHVGTRQLAAADFREWSLQLVKPLLLFDAALWGRRVSTGPTHVSFDDLHRHGHPDLVATAEQLCLSDGAIAVALGGEPGVTANIGPINGSPLSPKAKKKPDPSEKTLMLPSLCTGVHDPVSRSFSWLAVFRNDPADRFSEQERLLKQALTPHLMAAWLANRAFCLTYNDQDRPERRQSWAIVDRHGTIQDVTPRFHTTVSSEWPDFDGSRLPPEVAGPLLNKDGTLFASTLLLFEAYQVHSLYFIKVRPKRLSDGLSTRERLVAELVCDGLSYKEIAAQLAISPSTVRTHLRCIYDKLGVTTKVGLITSLS